MRKMNAPKMDVVRFKEADVVVASGALAYTMTLSNFGDNTPRNGVVSYNGQSYILDSENSYNSLMSALTAINVNGSTKIYSSDTAGANTLKGVFLNKEINSASGVESNIWNAKFMFDTTDSSFHRQ